MHARGRAYIVIITETIELAIAHPHYKCGTAGVFWAAVCLRYTIDHVPSKLIIKYCVIINDWPHPMEAVLGWFIYTTAH